MLDRFRPKPEIENTAEPVHSHADLTAEKDLKLRLDDLDRKLDQLMEMLCPVCGPKVFARIHPELAEPVVIAPADRNGHTP